MVDVTSAFVMPASRKQLFRFGLIQGELVTVEHGNWAFAIVICVKRRTSVQPGHGRSLTRQASGRRVVKSCVDAQRDMAVIPLIN